MLFFKSKTEDTESAVTAQAVDHSDRYVVTSILLEVLYAGILFLKEPSLALTYVYALIPMLLITAVFGTYLYNRDADMKLFGAITKLSASGIALQILADHIYHPPTSFSLIKCGISFVFLFFFLIFYGLLKKLLNHPFMIWLTMAASAAVYIVLAIYGVDPNGYGTTAWIRIMGYTVQLTDLTKICAVMFYAALFSSRHEYTDGGILKISSLFFFVNLLGSVWIKEIGSFFILYFLHLSILLIFMDHNKTKRIYILAIVAASALAVGSAFVLYKWMLPAYNAGTLNSLQAMIWPFVKKIYTRFSITANINMDPYGAGYQLLQAKKALWMSGLFGNTVNFNALPIAESDMAYVAFVSNFGFILGFYLILQFLRILLSGSELSRSLLRYERQDSIVVYGITVVIFLQAMMVILGSCNVIPFAGLPIPFLSRGNTYQSIVFAFSGLLLQLSMHKNPVVEEGGDVHDETQGQQLAG